MGRLPDAVGTDIEVDITDRQAVRESVRSIDPDLIFHCAAEKHAPEGEVNPELSAAVNIAGTANLLHTGVPLVLASTCKAADPETVYGAVKLVAERMVLNAGGWVARFYNVIESSGNVFEIWRNTPETEPILAMPCRRYFIHLEQAVELMVSVVDHHPGRYTIDPGASRSIPLIAEDLYPGRVKVVAPRRGDRRTEPLHAKAEHLTRDGDLLRIINDHDAKGYA